MNYLLPAPKETILKPRPEIREALEHSHEYGLPSHVARHVPQNVVKVLAGRPIDRIKGFLKTAKDPQILVALTALATGIVCTGVAERNNLAQTPDNLNYILSLLQFYISPLDTADQADSLTRLTGIASALSIPIAVISGIIEGSQKLKEANSLKKAIEDGTQPCPFQNHMVGIGFSDPLMYAEDSKGDSFVKRARQMFKNIVPVQASKGFYNPSDLGTPLNDKGFYANLDALNDGTPQAEMIEHILVSGAHTAKALVINAQRQHELFEEFAIDDSTNLTDRPDLSMASSFLKNTLALREATTSLTEPPRTVLIVPRDMRQKAFDHSGTDQLSPWARAVLANFGANDELMPGIKGVVVPEKVFIAQLVNQLKERGLDDRKIYIDAEGQIDGEGKAARCAKALTKALGVDDRQIISDPGMARAASISVMLRHSNRHLDASSRVNQNRLNHDFIFYLPTTREDTIEHDNTPDQQRRIPILYKQAIADEVIALTGKGKSDFSIEALREQGLM